MAQDQLKKHVVIIGGSAGSLEVILQMAPSWPVHNGIIYVLVLHRKNDNDSILAELLSTRTDIRIREAEDKEAMLPDTIYLAPPDYHLLFEDQHELSLDSSEKVHYSRPSIDVSFISAAEVFGNAVTGILLSGANSDGAAGLEMIRKAGGFTIVQNPRDAEVSYMPDQALLRCDAHAIMTSAEIAAYLQHLV